MNKNINPKLSAFCSVTVISSLLTACHLNPLIPAGLAAQVANFETFMPKAAPASDEFHNACVTELENLRLTQNALLVFSSQVRLILYIKIRQWLFNHMTFSDYLGAAPEYQGMRCMADSGTVTQQVFCCSHLSLLGKELA